MRLSKVLRTCRRLLHIPCDQGGGATAAANAGIRDRMFKRRGLWASENAKDGYVEDNLDSMLSVSKS